MNDVKQKSTSQCINVEPTPMNTTLKNALTYAKSNYKVFPLKRNTKSVHLCTHWVEETTNQIMNSVTKCAKGGS